MTPPAPPRKKRKPRPRLLPDAWLGEVRRLWQDGLSDDEIGERFGVSSHTVYQFRRRQKLIAPKKWGEGPLSKPYRQPRQLVEHLSWDFTGQDVQNPWY